MTRVEAHITIVAGGAEMHLTEQQARDLLRHLRATLEPRPAPAPIPSVLPVDLARQGREHA